MEAINMLDDSKNVQVFSREGCEEFSFLNIERIKEVGKGS